MTTNNCWNTPDLTTDGQYLIGNTSTGRPSAANLTAGSNVTIVNSSTGSEIQTSPINDLVVMQRDSISSTAAIDYTCRLSDFNFLMLVGNNVQAASSDGIGVACSTNGGISFDTNDANYVATGWQVDDGGVRTWLDDSSLPGAKLQIYGSTTNPAGSGANQVGSFVIYIWKPTASLFVKSTCYSGYMASSGDFIIQYWGSLYRNATSVNALRLKATSGNMSTGEVVMYGGIV